MRYDFTPSERWEMALWSFPIVSDHFRARYGEAISNIQDTITALSFSHSQFWRALILDDRTAARKTRAELLERLQRLGLRPDFVSDLDEEVLDELMDVVTQRFHRSPQKASICSHILLDIAKGLVFKPEVVALA